MLIPDAAQMLFSVKRHPVRVSFIVIDCCNALYTCIVHFLFEPVFPFDIGIFIIYLAGNPQVKGDPKGTFVANYANSNDAQDKGELKWDASATCKQSNVSTVVNNGNGWENPCCMVLLDKENAAPYSISIKMENASETGILLAFGYCA